MNGFWRFILRRKHFAGQFRIFYWLFNRKLLTGGRYIVKPLAGTFKIHVNTNNYIDSSIYYTGDYEPSLKIQFQRVIGNGTVILDIGANIGFHTLYFSELSGPAGTVVAFEPIESNFNALKENIRLNNSKNIIAVQTALGEKAETLNVYIDAGNTNPGAFSLFEKRGSNTEIPVAKGDDELARLNISHVDFIKVDVEGFEIPVLRGLMETIKRCRPTIVFEYDRNYQRRYSFSDIEIFDLLKNCGYSFFLIKNGDTIPFSGTSELSSGNILALIAGN